MTDIFLSYRNSEGRRPLVRRLAIILRAYELDVWWDYGLEAGEGYRAQIMDRLSRAKVVAPLWCEESIVSRWVLMEAEMGKDKLVPARLQNVNPPDAFESIQCADLIGWDGEIDHPRVVAYVERLCGRLGVPFHAASDMIEEFRALPRLRPLPEAHQTKDYTDGPLSRDALLADLRATWRDVVRGGDLGMARRFLNRVRRVAPGSGLEFEIEEFLGLDVTVPQAYPTSLEPSNVSRSATLAATYYVKEWAELQTRRIDDWKPQSPTRLVGDWKAVGQTRGMDDWKPPNTTRSAEDWKTMGPARSSPTQSRFNANANPLPAGCRLGDEFEIQRVLGQGGFSVTYEARALIPLNSDVGEGTEVALKEFLPASIAERSPGHLNVIPLREDEFDHYQSMFLEEALVLGRLHHTSIARVHALRRGNGTAYLVMELIEGQTLSEHVEALIDSTGHGCSLEELKNIAKPLLEAVELMHQLALVHRDIKPSNILLRQDGTPVLIDFGGATAIETANRSVIATPEYSPPEQLMQTGRIGPGSDIFALARTFLFALGGRALTNIKEPSDLEQRLLSLRVDETFIRGLIWALSPDIQERPLSIATWRGLLFANPAHSETSKPIRWWWPWS